MLAVETDDKNDLELGQKNTHYSDGKKKKTPEIYGMGNDLMMHRVSKKPKNTMD